MEIEKVNVIDTRLVSTVPQVEMIRGPATISKNVLKLNSANTSAWQFNVAVNTEGCALDLRCYLHVVASFDITIVNAGADITASIPNILQAGSNISLGPLPLNSLFSAGSSVSINETQIQNFDVANYGDMIYRMYDMKKLNEELPCPSYPEVGFAQYGDAFLTTANACGSYADSSPFGGINNGGYAITLSNNATTATWLSGTPKTVTAQVVFYEPLNMSPFELSQKNVNSPYYIRNMLINLVIGSAKRVFRFGESPTANCSIVPVGTNNGASPPVATGLNVTNVVFSAVNPVTTVELHYMMLTPPLVAGFSLPPQSIIHTHNTLCNSVVGTTFDASQSQKIVLSNQNCNGCPRYMIIGCKQQNTQYDATSATWYYPITNLNISEGNQQNLLASLEQVDLYNINRRNGSRQDYLSFIGAANSVSFGADGTPAAATVIQTCSAPVILELGKDISLPFNVVNGSSGNFTFTIQATCQNSEKVYTIAAPNHVPTMFVCFVFDSYFVTDAKTKLSSLKQSFLTSSEVMGADVPNKQESDVQHDANELTGGALHKMHNSGKGRVQNVSSKSAMSRRVVY